MATVAPFEEPKDMDEFLKLAKDPLVSNSNMVAEMRDDVVDIIVQFTEGKYANDYEKSSSVSTNRPRLAHDMLGRA